MIGTTLGVSSRVDFKVYGSLKSGNHHMATVMYAQVRHCIIYIPITTLWAPHCGIRYISMMNEITKTHIGLSLTIRNVLLPIVQSLNILG